jgi:hypothetical protein
MAVKRNPTQSASIPKQQTYSFGYEFKNRL